MGTRIGAGAVGLLAALSAMVGGCSSGDEVGDAVRDETADKGLEVVGENLTWDPNQLVNEGEPIQIEWWVWGFEDEARAMADAYQEVHPNVDIQVLVQPWEDYWTKLPLELQDGAGPAIFNIHNSQHDNIIDALAPYDVDLDDLSADYVNVAPHVIDGEVHYIDYGLMSGVVYYNTDLWEAAGLTDDDIPTTWDELREVAKQLTIREGDELVQAGFNVNDQFNAIQYGLAYQLGQNMFTADLTTPDVDNEANLAVIERLLGIYADGSGDKDFGPATDTFGQGLSAMVYAWGHFGGTLADEYPDLEWSAFQTPVPDRGGEPYAFDRANGESTIGINANADPAVQAVAQDFLRFYLTDTERLEAMCLALGVFPTYGPLTEDPDILASPVLEAYGDLDHYIWPGPFPATFEGSITTMWEDILYNGADPAEALATAEETIATDLANVDFVSLEDQYPGYTVAD